MIDTHCHLTDQRLFNQIDAVLDRALSAGVSHMLTIGTDIDDDVAALQLCEKHPFLRCAIGIHPNNTTADSIGRLGELEALARSPNVAALGEMGLDYFHAFADRTLQRQVFEAQLDMATRLQLPAVIHSRQSIADTLEVMKHFPAVRAVFHCFTGTLEESRQIIGAGYAISFTGVVTYKNAAHLRQVTAEAPADRYFMETDAPYLSPEPLRRQKINEPALVIHTARTVAETRGLTYEQLDAQTTANVRKFFNWPPEES
jgi:TatD DNase family protein